MPLRFRQALFQKVKKDVHVRRSKRSAVTAAVECMGGCVHNACEYIAFE